MTTHVSHSAGAGTALSPAELRYGDFAGEYAATRRILERYPDGKGEWRPHERSRTLAQLINAATILRIAAVLAAIQGTAHGALFIRAKPLHGAAEVAVIEAMKSNRFEFAGATRSYWDFYFGYGLEAAAVCLVEAVLFWQLARIADSHPTLVRPAVALFVLANVGHALLMGRYFFTLPLVFDLLIAACLGWAFVAAAR
jgi:hypothetical protein